MIKIVFEERGRGKFVAWFVGAPLDIGEGKTRNDAVANLIYLHGGVKIHVVHVSHE